MNESDSKAESTQNLGELTRRLRENTKNQVQEIEETMQNVLQNSSKNMMRSVENELNTVKTDMVRQVVRLTDELRDFHITQWKHFLSTCLGVLGVFGLACGVMVMLAALRTQWAQSEMTDLAAKVTRLENRIRELKPIHQKLQTWGLQPMESEGVRFIVLPRTMHTKTGKMNDGRNAIILEE